MASVVQVQVPARVWARHRRSQEGRSVEAALDLALSEFHRVERACTRFDTTSALMKANSTPRRWHRAPEPLYSTLLAAKRAHRSTGGLFDPRVLDRLVELGYDRSFHHMVAAGQAAGAGHAAESGQDEAGPADRGHRPQPAASGGRRDPWRPTFVPGLRLVRLGDSRVDLGGIGKSVALRRAADRLARVTGDFLVDAGGDIYAAGRPRAAHGWRIGVESPRAGGEALAVLELSDRAVATSSIRLRRWRSADRIVHHLIDPLTGEPGGAGLAAVTVVHPDPVSAEVWAKALFLSGPDVIAERADDTGLAALWVSWEEHVGMTAAMLPYVIWERR